jgi:phenylacetate-coenzyme A ligase PaaK-like adenylate-forming protein
MPFRRLAAVEGRSDDIVHLPGCLGGTVAVPPHQLRAPVAAVPGLRQYQIRVDGTGFTVSVVLCDGAPADTPRRVRTALQHALVAVGAALPPIRVDVVAGIPRETGPGAKLKTVVRLP